MTAIITKVTLVVEVAYPMGQRHHVTIPVDISVYEQDTPFLQAVREQWQTWYDAETARINAEGGANIDIAALDQPPSVA